MFCYLRWQSSLICNGSVTSVANRVLPPPPAPRCLRPVDLANRTGVVSCWRGRLGSGCRMQESGMGVFSLCTFFLKHKSFDNESCVIIFISAYGPYIQRGHHQKILNTEQKSSNTESKNKTKILKYWRKKTNTEKYWIFFWYGSSFQNLKSIIAL